jgi:REP element-mobilizing transposase RayT
MEEGNAYQAPRNPVPQRRRPGRLTLIDREGRPNWVFLTVCIHRGSGSLTHPRVHQILKTVWSDQARGWLVHRYLLMPDHLHMICAPGSEPPCRLRTWIAYWKRLASQAMPADQSFRWQRDGWDTQIRNGDHLNRKWGYIRQNPVRAGLCSESEAWPYQGMVHPLIWTDIR